MVKQSPAFDPITFLSTVGVGRRMLPFRKGQPIYDRGSAADAVFVVQKGEVKLSVRSHAGNEAIIAILSEGDFVGQDSLVHQASRTTDAGAMTDCTLLRIEQKTMRLALAEHLELGNSLWSQLLTRNIRYEQDLLDQRCNFSEKRLARMLAVLAHFERHSGAQTSIPKFSHDILAKMVGTTRSRVCHFMKTFKTSGFIDYEHKGKLLRINRTLLDFSRR
jgi:CRP-like cAMP-binding protein